ncbi:hypothetical protein A2U01_0046024, partial [Trifolium medium]|nr:hypothetical protein [Trifolium medium]
MCIVSGGQPPCRPVPAVSPPRRKPKIT